MLDPELCDSLLDLVCPNLLEIVTLHPFSHISFSHFSIIIRRQTVVFYYCSNSFYLSIFLVNLVII